MKEFLQKLTNTRWGITVICVVTLAVWLLLSAALYKPFFKRFYDVLLSFIAIVVFSWLFLILIIVGAIKMEGNPFFVQNRPGKISKRTGKEHIFPLLKFRTMTCKKNAAGNLLPDEQRLTRYGKFLRSTSLDELPELFNIFIGHMSIVGPRPLLVKDMVFMTNRQRTRHKIRQGLTGLAQVNGRNCISWTQKLLYDEWYVWHVSLWLDFKIIIKTIGKVLRRSDVVRDGTASDLDYGDWLLAEGKIGEEEYRLKVQEAHTLLKCE